jgi:hypothetical protein
LTVASVGRLQLLGAGVLLTGFATIGSLGSGAVAQAGIIVTAQMSATILPLTRPPG